MLEHIVSRAGTYLIYIKRQSHTKDVTSENNWKFKLGLKSGDGVPIHVIGGFWQSSN